MRKTTIKEVPYVFKKLKTYRPEDVIAAGGTTAFAKLTNYDPKAFYHLEGEHLTQEEFELALSLLSK